MSPGRNACHRSVNGSKRGSQAGCISAMAGPGKKADVRKLLGESIMSEEGQMA